MCRRGRNFNTAIHNTERATGKTSEVERRHLPASTAAGHHITDRTVVVTRSRRPRWMAGGPGLGEWPREHSNRGFPTSEAGPWVAVSTAHSGDGDSTWKSWKRKRPTHPDVDKVRHDSTSRGAGPGKVHCTERQFESRWRPSANRTQQAQKRFSIPSSPQTSERESYRVPGVETRAARSGIGPRLHARFCRSGSGVKTSMGGFRDCAPASVGRLVSSRHRPPVPRN